MWGEVEGALRQAATRIVDDVANFLAHQAFADRRGRRDLSFGHIGLFARNQRVLDLLVLSGVENLDDGTEGYAVFGDVV